MQFVLERKKKMANENNMIQNIILENREKLSVTGITDILTFDEDEIVLNTEYGILEITGSDLKVEKLSLDSGEILARGFINSVNYAGDKQEKASGFFKSMFK